MPGMLVSVVVIYSHSGSFFHHQPDSIRMFFLCSNRPKRKTNFPTEMLMFCSGLEIGAK